MKITLYHRLGRVSVAPSMAHFMNLSYDCMFGIRIVHILHI